MDAITPAREVDLSRCPERDVWADARTGDPGPVLAMWLHDGAKVADPADAKRVEEAVRRCLAPAPRGAPANPLAHARAYTRADAPTAWAIRDQPRAGDVVVVADSGWTVVATPPEKPAHGGAHGWDPSTDRAMRAIFLAAGPDIRARGQIPAVDNVQVAPFLGALLGLHWAPGTTDGDPRVLAPLLDPDGASRGRRGARRARPRP